jgi:hypothetical protein
MEGVSRMLKKAGSIFVFAICIGCFVTHAYGAKTGSTAVTLAILYFKIDSAEINPKFENDLKKILPALEADPAMGLSIEGYARQQGTPHKNVEVSQKRVQAVQQWFSKQGIATSRLKVKTLADSNPPARKSNTVDVVNDERVEIVKISLKQPLAVLPAAVHKFEPVVEGQDVVHAFIVQNKGSAPLKIQNVRTD